jgi:glycosyltransferase involved in cell wall biosynthesis|tara:strand:- start:463 stop:1446 length:984 start_codon:yes stop_codon:yes gene_type:complete
VKQVLFVSKGDNNPTTRYRISPLADALSKSGTKVILTDSDLGLIGKTNLLLKAYNSDVVVIQRKLYGAFLLFLLDHCCKKLIFDFDDAIFLRSNGDPSPHRETRFHQIVSRCSQVWAGNSYLVNHATASGAQTVHFVPTVIDPSKYPQTSKASPDQVTLVWLGSSSTRKYLEQHRDILEALGKAFPDIRLLVVSDFSFNLSHLQVDSVAWSEQAERSTLQQADIGIAPMEDNLWTQGKCALKVLQYMAAGLPVVSSDVGANAEVVEDGITGFLASSKEEWISAIGNLIANSELRNSLGQTGRLRVENNYNSVQWTDQQIMWLAPLLE